MKVLVLHLLKQYMYSASAVNNAFQVSYSFLFSFLVTLVYYCNNLIIVML